MSYCPNIYTEHEDGNGFTALFLLSNPSCTIKKTIVEEWQGEFKDEYQTRYGVNGGRLFEKRYQSKQKSTTEGTIR